MLYSKVAQKCPDHHSLKEVLLFDQREQLAPCCFPEERCKFLPFISKQMTSTHIFHGKAFSSMQRTSESQGILFTKGSHFSFFQQRIEIVTCSAEAIMTFPLGMCCYTPIYIMCRFTSVRMIQRAGQGESQSTQRTCVTCARALGYPGIVKHLELQQTPESTAGFANVPVVLSGKPKSVYRGRAAAIKQAPCGATPLCP